MIMKKVVLFMMVVAGFAMSSCNNSTSNNTESTLELNDADLYVYYFHYTRRCATCNAVENVTLEALNEYYADKMKEGDITFESINIEEKEGEEKANGLKIAGQALVVQKGDSQTDLTDKGFLYAMSEPAKLKAELKTAIDAALKQ
jgi:hypothetical protein